MAPANPRYQPAAGVAAHPAGGGRTIIWGPNPVAPFAALDPAAAAIWGCLDGLTPLDAIVEDVAAVAGLTVEEVAPGVSAVCSALEQAGFLGDASSGVGQIALGQGATEAPPAPSVSPSSDPEQDPPTAPARVGDDLDGDGCAEDRRVSIDLHLDGRRVRLPAWKLPPDT